MTITTSPERIDTQEITWPALAEKVDAWGSSPQNFGVQCFMNEDEHPCLASLRKPKPEDPNGGSDNVQNYVSMKDTQHVTAVMGYLAPLMGIVEEFGEFAEACLDEEPEDIADAAGDVAIYVAHYIGRHPIEVDWNRDIEDPRPTAPTGFLGTRLFWTRHCQKHIGLLYRAHLKRCQGIREMDDDEKFGKCRDVNLIGFLYSFGMLLKEHDIHDSVVSLGNKTFTKIVSKRNWSEDAAQGGNHSHK